METSNNWFDIKRESPEIEATIGGQPFLFNYFNTKLYIFNEEYEQFNHVFHTPEDRAVYIFGSKLLINELFERDFPTYYEPWPSIDDVEAYIQCEMEGIDDELRSSE